MLEKSRIGYHTSELRKDKLHISENLKIGTITVNYMKFKIKYMYV